MIRIILKPIYEKEIDTFSKRILLSMQEMLLSPSIKKYIKLFPLLFFYSSMQIYVEIYLCMLQASFSSLC